MALAANQYIGNPDFRGYINKVAPEFLSYVGNDGGINMGALNKAGGVESNYKGQSLNVKGAQNAINELYSKYLGLTGGSTVQQGASYYSPPTVYAPKLDVAAMNAKARSQAENAVNPYYTKALNDYLEKAAFAKATEEEQTKTNIKNYEDTLAQTLAQNETTKTRTAQDTALNEAQIARTEDQFQTDSGQAFDAARIAEARRAAVAGITGGTAGASQEALQTKNATQEQRQTQEFQDQKDQQELFKNRSFEDIVTSNAQATTSKEKGVKQAQFNLDTFIKNQALEEKATRNDFEKARQEEIAAQAKMIASQNFYNYINTLSNPVALAAIQRYGGAF